ncbi:PhzF family phenazine biosynthesis protein [Mesorhizobium sp. YIM 152430]|uniref:PhzF family phenazine biosynthesis protein n=1 Tax=Mesorhizobium sp. YIM 152430 TaxID=3031761 RepID=UPI0023DAD94F|nr:PhzF family phenazine biosynthesis protein [Mesorhizobium sp. YIM 152430]MDF1598303.1 PhzF family phenazine biosynthesis protein [Mesorhizobium sp. YIM 152430]
MTSARRYAVYDVFADQALAGNPLAIVFDADGLSDDAMQKIAKEFNLSETVFVLPAEGAGHASAMRIFTPGRELPFAGHPTVGTAVALSDGGQPTDLSILVLEQKIGLVRCAVSREGDAAFAEFDLPRLPKRLDCEVDKASFAAALGLGAHEVGFENHVPQLWTAGVPYATVPVAGLDAAARARCDGALWAEIAPQVDGIIADAYVYCRETVGHDCAFHARMFAPYMGILEDPATGSAAAAFAGAIHHFDRPGAGSHRYWIEQGIEMGRPSRIRLEIDVEGGAITAARIGGHAVKVAEGTLFV